MKCIMKFLASVKPNTVIKIAMLGLILIFNVVQEFRPKLLTHYNLKYERL